MICKYFIPIIRACIVRYETTAQRQRASSYSSGKGRKAEKNVKREISKGDLQRGKATEKKRSQKETYRDSYKSREARLQRKT
jgi:hypothetical protein